MEENQNIIITGASSGIGFELTKQFLSQGHTVYTISRSTDSLSELKVNNDYTNLNIISFDLLKDDFSVLNEYFKNVVINHLVNNAGLLINKTIDKLSVDDFRMQYEVNVIAVFSLVKSLLGSFVKGSTICNITSMGGINGSSKFPGLLGYSSSKGALSILTECLAEELKEYGINVNALALGAVQTEMLSQAFPGYQASVSASEMATYINNFVQRDSKLFNGKIISVSNSTP